MSARSLLWKMNQRTLRREWRQYLVIVLLVASGVALSVGGSVTAFNLAEPPQSQFGNGQFAVMTDSPADTEAALTKGRFVWGRRESATLAVDGSAQRVTAIVMDPFNEVTSPLAEITNGRWPTDETEVALSDRALVDGPAVGDGLTIDGRRLTVVGVVENPTRLDQEFVFLTSLDSFGLRESERSLEFLVDGDPRQLPLPSEGAVSISSADGPSVRTAVTLGAGVISILGMVEVALLVGAGFQVIAQRRSRQYGLLAAAGATPKMLKSAATLSGAIVGIVGVVCGLGTAAAAVAVLLPRLEASVGHRVQFDLPWVIVVFNAVLAVVVASLASRWPARPLSEVPVAALLTSQRPKPAAVGRLAFVGLVGAVLGGLALAFGFARLNPLLALLGVLLAPIGVLLTSPIIVRTAGRWTKRFQLVPRMAGRAIERSNRRSAAIVAALALALSLPVGIAVVTTALDERASAKGPNVAESTFIAWLPGADDGGSRIPSGLDQAALDRARHRVLEVDPTLALVRIEAAVAPNPLVEQWDFDALGPTLGVEPVLSGRPASDQCLVCDTYGFGTFDSNGNEISYVVGDSWIGSPELLTALGIEADLLGSAPAIARSDEFVMVSNGILGDGAPIAVDPAWPQISRIPDLLIAPDLVGNLGFERVGLGWHVSGSSPLSAEERAALRTAVGPELLLEFSQEPQPSSGLRQIALAAGLTIGVGIAFAAVGLFVAELSGDLKTLVAIGASPRNTRSLAASIAAILAGCGALAGVAIGYLPLIALLSAEEFSINFVVPWSTLVSMVVLFPALAGVVGWTVSRSASDLSGPAML